MASLAECRRIVKAARRRGCGGKLTITENRAARDLHNPARHRMSGTCVVVHTSFDPVSGAESARYLWESNQHMSPCAARAGRNPG